MLRHAVFIDKNRARYRFTGSVNLMSGTRWISTLFKAIASSWYKHRTLRDPKRKVYVMFDTSADECMMDAEFEHTLDMEDLCRQMDRSKLICIDTNRDDILAAVHATRYYLRCDPTQLPESDVWCHLSHRATVYDTYMSLIRFSANLQFLVRAMKDFQVRLGLKGETNEDVNALLRLVYFIDREICLCAGMD